MTKSQDSAALLGAAQSHFKALGMPHTDVPEWIVGEKPARIYWRPLTCLEQEEMRDKTGGTDLEIFVHKALDANGDRLFDIEDKLIIKRAVSQQVISRIAVKMMQLPTSEDAEKN